MKYLVTLCVAILLSVGLLPVSQAETTTFSDALSELTSSKLKQRAQAVEKLIITEDPRLEELFQALLNSNLYYRKADKVVAIKVEKGTTTTVTNALTGKQMSSDGKWKKIIINNAVRRDLRSVIANLQLTSDSIDKRLNAIEQILSQLDDKQIQALENRLKVEEDNKVQQQLRIAIAALKLKIGQGDALSLLTQLEGNAHPSVRQVVVVMAENAEDIKIKAAATSTLEKIDGRIARYSNVETLFFGLSLGSVLVLAAIGLAITFGVMGVINMAHGELIMLGAYTTYVVQLWLPNLIEYSLLIAIPLAFLVSGTVGILIERGVIRFLYGRPLETLLATFGVSLILQQIVRSVFSPLNRAVETPEWMSGVWQVNEVLALTWNRLYIIIFSLLVFALLFFILKKTRLGLMVRAVSQNREMARAMGVRSSWVDAMTFGLGSGIAGVAGVALSQLTNVGPNLGQTYIIDSFMVVVFGGVGNLWGTLVAGLGLGVTNKLLEPWSGAVLAKILVLIFIILFIQKRPKGLFPQKGRAADN
jgi:urea transport system permease protein